MPAEIRVSVSEGESGRFLSASGSFTVRDRNFFLESNPEESTLMLDGAGIELDGGQRFFIPLGQDMAPGSYTIKIKGGAATDGFLTLYRIVGGAYSDARFYKEVAR